MKKVIFSIFVVFGFVNAYAFDINSYCHQVADSIGGSYVIEKTCREQEHTAKSNISSMSVPSRIEKYCKEVAQSIGGSYVIMETCIQQELEAKNSL